MRITLSFAVTADGYLDDCTSKRLVISTPEDWAAVHRLRNEHDALLVGAETLRRDNPSLRGMATKVSLTRSGELAPDMRVFTSEEARCILFSPIELPHLASVAEVIVCREPITARYIVTELERRGVRCLMVEGGAQVLRMFLNEGMADTVRMARNPNLKLGAEGGFAHFLFEAPAGTPCTHEELGGMEVTTWQLKPDTTTEDLIYLRQAIEVSRNCTPSATSYCVGAVIRTADGRIFTGYTHETSPTHHAEQEALLKALAAAADLRGATIYASMEPCSTRKSEPKSCTQLILEHGLSRVVFACYEPDCFVCCQGAATLRAHHVDVRVYTELADEVLHINRHLR